MATTQSKYSRRFDEEFKREVAALASKPGATQEQVARALGVNAFSVASWKKRAVWQRVARDRFWPRRQRGGVGAAHPQPGA